MIEIQWFFVRWVPDLLRKEPRNVGLLVRIGDELLVTRFLGEQEATIGQDQAPPVIIEKLPRWLHEGGYAKMVEEIREPIGKYGAKSMLWVPKKFKQERYHIILGGARFAEKVDVDEMWKEMVA